MRIATAAIAVAVAVSPALHAQTIQTLNHQTPEIPIYGFLLTDGSALIQGSNQTLTLNGQTYGNPNGSYSHWFKLTPDENGSYLNGTWRQVVTATTYLTGQNGILITDAFGNPVIGAYTPYAGGGALMADGRLALVGGEYLTDQTIFWLTNESAVYDPFVDAWAPIIPPQPFNGQGGFQWFGDSPTTVLPNGSLLVGQKLSKRAVALDPQFYTWVQYGEQMSSKNDINAEEGWTLLPDGSLLTVDVDASPKSERLIPSGDVNQYHWIEAGNTPKILRSPPDACCIPFDNGQLVYNPPGEIGPAILRPDGTVFATGALPYLDTRGHTAIYHPGPNYSGTWTAGPDFQPGDNAGDNFGVLERNGNVLVAGDAYQVSETRHMSAMMAKRQMAQRTMQRFAANAQTYPTARLYEFNGSAMKVLPVGIQAGASLLPLPTGQVLVMGYNEQLFTPSDNTYNPAWAPSVGRWPRTVARNGNYEIWGTQFNGLSQACAYGDELQCATNYPLVRIINSATHHVVYGGTRNHSTMAVATGSAPVSTWFHVPKNAETGESILQVVANGIPSVGVKIVIE